MTPYARQILPVLRRVVEKPAKTRWTGTLLLTASIEVVQKYHGCIPNPRTVLEALADNERAGCYLHSLGLPYYEDMTRDEAIEFVTFACLSLEQEIEDHDHAKFNSHKSRK